MAGAVALAGTGAAAQTAELPAILDAAGRVEIVILGEVHDNPGHHARQAEVLARLGPSAIVFEMISAEEAGIVTPALAVDADALADALDWETSGWPDFAYYAPLFAFAAEVPIYGAHVDRETSRAAFEGGAAAVFAGDAARFGLTEPLPDAEQEAREAETACPPLRCAPARDPAPVSSRRSGPARRGPCGCGADGAGGAWRACRRHHRQRPRPPRPGACRRCSPLRRPM